MSEFEDLYNLYYKDVFYYVLKLTDYQEYIAEEVTQESFYQAFTSLTRFRGECSVKSWLCQIAKNTYYKYLRTHAKETYLDEEESRIFFEKWDKEGIKIGRMFMKAEKDQKKNSKGRAV